MRSARVIAGAFWCFAGAASGGAYIETQERNTRTNEAGPLQKIYLQSERARFESGPDAVSILQGDTLTVLDPSEKTYVVLDRAAMEQMGAQMNDMQAQMQAQLAKLPPEQRAVMEQMMKSQLPPTPPKPAEVKVVDTGKSETVDGRSCRLWNVTRDAVLEAQHCVVPFDSVPGDEDVRGAFERMSRFFAQMKSAFPAYASAADTEFDAFGKLDGFPVRTREYDKGKPTGVETRVVSWREESVPAGMFEVPAGYRKREMPAAPSR